MLLLFVKLLTGNVINILADTTDTIKLLKFKIKLHLNIPTYNQKLFFNNTQLDDHLTLADYPIKNNSTIHMYPSIKTGFI